MQEIPSLIRKLQSLYEQQHPKTELDIDLMLDQTRQLYAALLDWRSQAAPTRPHTTSAAAPVAAAATGVSRAAEKPSAGVVPPVIPARTIPDVPAAPATQSAAGPVPEKQTSGQTQKDPGSVPAGKPAVAAQTAVPATQAAAGPVPEKQTPGQTQKDPGSVPAGKPAVAAQTAAPAAGPASPQPAAATPPVTPQVAEPAGTQAPARTEKPVPQPGLQQYSDIQRLMGINDRYQIISELFHNEQEAYQSAIAAINASSTEQEALDWLHARVSWNYNWSEEHDTVQLLYNLISRFFSGADRRA